MDRLVRLPILALCVMACSTARAQSAEPALTVGVRHEVRSHVLGEDRKVLVYVPSSYTDSSFAVAAYPVIYILDGDAHFHSASGLLQFLSEGVNGVVAVPEHILVAIPNTDRTRDLTPTHSLIDYFGDQSPRLGTSGGGEAFLDFLEDELIPFIDGSYRTRPFRTFVGHSFGGLAVLHAFVHREGLFQAHIAIDPSLWWDGGTLVRQLEGKADSGWAPRGSVYLSNAGIPLPVDGVDRMQVWGTRFVAAMERLESSDFRGRYEVFPDEYHSSVALLSLYGGLYHAFDGYRIVETDFKAGRAVVADRMRRFAERTHLDLPVHPAALEFNARWMVRSTSQRDAGLDLLRLNVEQFPASARAHASLARGLLVAGDTTASIVHLGRALELREDPELRALLDSLRRE